MKMLTQKPTEGVFSKESLLMPLKGEKLAEIKPLSYEFDEFPK